MNERKSYAHFQWLHRQFDKANLDVYYQQSHSTVSNRSSFFVSSFLTFLFYMKRFIISNDLSSICFFFLLFFLLLLQVCNDNDGVSMEAK